MAETQSNGVNVPEGSQCPDGYKRLLGPLCVKTTNFTKTVSSATPSIPNTTGFTNPSCESLIASLNSVSEQIQKALGFPTIIMSVLERLANYPADKAAELLGIVNGALDDVGSALDNILSGGPLETTKELLEKAMDCPYIADSALGAQIAGVLSILGTGASLASSLVSGLKGILNNTVSGLMKNLTKLPAAALANLLKLVMSFIQSSGVGALLTQLQNLEACIEAACSGYEVAKKLPTSASNFLSSINGKIDEATGAVKSAGIKAKNQTQELAIQVAEDFISVKDMIKISK